MQTLDRLNGAALQNEMVTKRFHGLHPDPILYQKWQNLVLETAKMCVHDVQWDLHCVKMKRVLQSNFEHPEVNQRIFMSSEADVPDFAPLSVPPASLLAIRPRRISGQDLPFG